MEAVARILTANRAELLPGERAGEISSTFPDSEFQYACPLCNDHGWRRREGQTGLSLCECMISKMRAERMSVIPERFKDSTFESYRPCNHRQEKALFLMRGEAAGSWYLTGAYGSGKTHLLYAQYRQMVLDGKTRFHVRTTRELVEELRRAELDGDFVSPVMAAASKPEYYHLFWDDIDKLKPTDFKTEVLFDLVDTLYRQEHGLTVTSNYQLQDLVERERMHPAIVRRLDDMCRVVEL